MLERAEAELASALSREIPDLDQAKPLELEAFSSAKAPARSSLPIDAIEDVELDLRIELGRTEMLIEDVLRLAEGSVVPLDKLAGDPVDILVNGRLIARGEVLVLNDNFCVRVAEILTPDAA
ncbi:MAG: flagellar motor switch protein FliN [Planctomycetes bacterium]|nr:flagellar motor switch protein FliN [Planctomycetota bacterium]